MWPDIKKAHPDAELHICYGWDLFDVANLTNPERMKWKESVQQLMGQDGIIHHGRVGQEELKKIRESCGIWAYPTYFQEINCITALQAQSAGLVPVVIELAALKETVGSGIKIQGDIRDESVQETFKQELISLMSDPKRIKKESKKAKEFAKGYNWNTIADKWIEEFTMPITKPLVTVATVTIREGFWDSMAQNLANQTYENFEWLIVDDHKDDRSEIAKKYAKKYNLKINYIRGDKAKGTYKRKYGLVRANNIAWKNAYGELIVWLQDFIYPPQRGIEWLVDLYRHHPNKLLAPVDDYWHCIKPNKKNKEDWFDGKKYVTKHSWKNIRNDHNGIRITDNVFDFEMNYSATPKHILDNLNGWYEFFDDNLGFDNTEIAKRADELGYKILLDDSNIATCLDLWPHIGGTAENISDRERHLALPVWLWFHKELKKGAVPAIRDEKIDKSIALTFDVPEGLTGEKATQWIHKHAEEIALLWGDYETGSINNSVS